MKRRKFIRLNSIALSGALLHPGLKAAGLALTATNEERKSPIGFEDAATHSPYILWQWMNGCVTKEGITYDLEQFKKAGINDVQQFLVGGIEADVTDPEITILGDKWMDLMRFALDECRRLGITFGTHNCPGWSASGAPGILPEDSMQKLVWTKTVVRGEDSLAKIITPFEPDPEWNFYKDIYLTAVPSGSQTVAKDAVLILTDNLNAQHKLKQQLPVGEWLVFRFGHTITGHMNLTAPASGQGLEVDKMSKESLEKFWALYPAKLLEMAGDHAGKTFKRFELDSFEAGEQTWTKKMAEEFKVRCGYELFPWLPSLAGLTIESKELTDRFKQDWQQTITSLFAENYYGHLATLINRSGIEFLVEPYGTGKVNFDINAIRGVGDILMCEFWWGSTWGWDSIGPVASNAHVNGKKIVAAEAFTGQPQFAWKVDLFDLKGTGDRAFCNGVNLFVLHASAHQPWPYAQPGMTMGWWGTQFGPSQTWWSHGAPEWIQYVSACQSILQKGLFVADICFLQLAKQRYSTAPIGYKADTCTAKELISRFDVKENRWSLPDGMQYRIVVLPANCSVDLALAKKLEEMVNKGGVVVGGGFNGTAGITGLASDKEVKEKSEILFGRTVANGTFEKTLRKVGRGKVYTGYEVTEVLQLESIEKDVALQGEEEDILWIHRTDKDAHYYFVSNQSDSAKEIQASFRVSGMQPELWNPETNNVIDAPFWKQENGRTIVLLSFEPRGSLFVVFRNASVIKKGLSGLQINGKPVKAIDYFFAKDGKPFIRLKEVGSYTVTTANDKTLKTLQKKAPIFKTLDSDWDVSFEENRGAPANAHFDKLMSLTEHPTKGIKFFSGTSIYRKKITLSKNELSKDVGIFLDLGEVKNIATITLNSKKVQTIWKPPFAAEVQSYCKIGENSLEVAVTNLWPNRMIGDEAELEDCVWGEERYFKYVDPNPKIGRNLLEIPDWVKHKKERPSKNRVTFCTMDFFDKEDPLLPSGLLGPVTLSIETVWNVSQ